MIGYLVSCKLTVFVLNLRFLMQQMLTSPTVSDMTTHDRWYGGQSPTINFQYSLFISEIV